MFITHIIVMRYVLFEYLPESGVPSLVDSKERTANASGWTDHASIHANSALQQMTSSVRIVIPKMMESQLPPGRLNIGTHPPAAKARLVPIAKRTPASASAAYLCFDVLARR